ncbi:tRNA/snRNA/rRNA pseudouridine synthase Pus7 [Schizosaccharomyces pombe]|uniref:Multisubstrate pseudouridine synthase 7 n=1 Tax=Schizosaccharomyces pombe (strain 972 / ATCC 24843) TaxID=284812 RepID=PUS7_SCHPO|nr:putative pseudouridine synthase [Schizosaccharomyces pombe]O74343.1 RecName: Full=Multisubstrate pseudouridine synthase 7; AltName: Full=RNA pseudouridylate synthase 7; AltName: Full=RNA-uridine isomerase 7 [Schizosaccharomyces pombe 972h-]CAA20114.1 pseudouridine synthase (predicted) [Schizosaccharomyces pombe]|eukprot:NP_595812.1 putative pseudouridine synthase [Schizosaccharomyces pombe]
MSQENHVDVPRKRIRIDQSESSRNLERNGLEDEANAPSDLSGQKFYMTESDVGIDAFLNPNLPSIDGIIKARFTDFAVFEVDTDGNIVHLTDMEAHDPILSKATGDKETEDAKDSSNQDISNDQKAPSFKEQEPATLPILPNDLQSIIPKGIGNEFIQSLHKLSVGEITDPISLILPENTPPMDKGQRTILHQFIRNNFSGLESSTKGNGTFTVSKTTRKNQPRSRRDPRLSWKALGGEYCHFHLYKENRDSMDCLGKIARLLKVPTRTLSIAGTKDRRGVTCQRVAIHHVRASRLAQLNSGSLKNSTYGFLLGNYSYKNSNLRLGDLKGNEFHIVVRNVITPKEKVVEALNSLKEHGFINYFGLQRFGTSSVGTHTIGVRLLQSDWKGAVDLILSPRPEHTGSVKEAIDLWHSTHDAEASLRILPRRMIAESSILETWSRSGNQTDYLGAFQRIPRHLRSIYPHAYQSYVWNRVASWRIKNLGDRPVVGDLVYSTESNGLSQKSPIVDPEAPDLLEDLPVSSKLSARPIEEDEVNNFSIYDIVLPLPGRNVIYPKNETFDIYKSVMNEASLDPLNMSRKDRELSLPGDYRKLLVRPENMEFNFIKYDNMEQQLILTDKDRLENRSISVSSEVGKHTAVTLKFVLPSSAYATMALREALRTATASGDQRMLMPAVLKDSI